MVVNEETKCRNIFELASFLSIPIPDVVHIFLTSKYIPNGVVHGVVEQALNMVLVITNIVWVTIEHLTHLKHAGCCGELVPILLGNFWNGINSYTIEIIFLN